MSVRDGGARAKWLTAMNESDLAERMAGSFEAFSIIMLNAADETRRFVKDENGAPIGTIVNAIRVMSACDACALELDTVVTILKARHGVSKDTSIIDATDKTAKYSEWLAEYDRAAINDRKTFFTE